jgi:hypothetical protein
MNAPKPEPGKVPGESPPHITTLGELLQDVPLHAPRAVQKLFFQPQYGHLLVPEGLVLHCAQCDGARRHQRADVERLKLDDTYYYCFATFRCANCFKTAIVFGLKAQRQGENIVPGICTKVYQEPQFGHPIPKRLFSIIGETNREHFLQARRAIARGLGIGAYAYYRRIVENEKFDLVSVVLDIAEKTNAPNAQVELLKQAQRERQFSKAIELLREASAVPAILLIDGHNPLALLHDALSEGIHALPDDECLRRAQEAEVILCELVNRMQLALTESNAVKDALTNIVKRRSRGSTSAASQ